MILFYRLDGYRQTDRLLLVAVDVELLYDHMIMTYRDIID